MAYQKKVLQLKEAVVVHNCSVTLDSIELPKENVPGNRPIYLITVQPVGSVTQDKQKETLRFDPFDSGKEYPCGKKHFQILENPKGSHSLLLQWKDLEL